MKALYAAGAGDYGLVERPLPRVAEDEALVRVVRSALCHTDVNIRAGRAGHVRYPFIPGHEFAGVVEECGALAGYLRPGDRVAVHSWLNCGRCPACLRGDNLACESFLELGAQRDGGFAEFCAIPARKLVKIPAHLSLAEAALAEPLANAISALSSADVQVGERIVIIGPGPIGLLALQVARLSNPAALVLVGTRDERLAVGARLGATHVVNSAQTGAAAAIDQALGGKGANVVVECAGTPGAFELATKVVGLRGRICCEGTYPTDAVLPLAAYDLLTTRAARLIGINGWLSPHFVRALDLLASGRVDGKALITHTLPLTEWEAAFALITDRKSEAIKVEFAPNGMGEV